MKILTRLRNLFRSSTASEKWEPDSIYPDDVFVVSYPKSGNTWMRFLIGNYLTGNDCTFENCHRITPDIHMNPEYCSEVERPRFIKSHSPYHPRYPNVIYIVRDGRDVAVSYYHHCLKMQNIPSDTSFSEFLGSFNAGEVDEFGTWSDHVHSWLDQGADNMILVRYEDLLNDTESEFRRVLSFTGLSVDEAALSSALEASRFENMQRQERNQHDQLDVLKDSDASKRFVRKGKHGAWKNAFEERYYEAFLDTHASALQRLGYLSEK